MVCGEDNWSLDPARVHTSYQALSPGATPAQIQALVARQMPMCLGEGLRFFLPGTQPQHFC